MPSLRPKSPPSLVAAIAAPGDCFSHGRRFRSDPVQVSCKPFIAVVAISSVTTIVFDAHDNICRRFSHEIRENLRENEIEDERCMRGRRILRGSGINSIRCIVPVLAFRLKYELHMVRRKGNKNNATINNYNNETPKYSRGHTTSRGVLCVSYVRDNVRLPYRGPLLSVHLKHNQSQSNHTCEQHQRLCGQTILPHVNSTSKLALPGL